MLRHYSLKTEYKGKRNAVLIPFSIFRFTEDIALRFRQAITTMLLDASLKDCFDALLRLQMPELYPTRYNTIIIKTNKDKPDAEIFPSGIFVKKGDAITFNATGEISFGSEIINAGTSNEKIIPALIFGPDATKTKPQPGFNWYCGLTMNMFSLCFRIGSGAWLQAGSLITTIADADGEIFLVANDVNNTYGDNRGSWTVNVMATTNGGVGQIMQGKIVNSGADAPHTTITKTMEESSTHPSFSVGYQAVITHSNIYVKENDKISFSATGEIILDKEAYRVNKKANVKFNADGDPHSVGDVGALLQGKLLGSLCFRIGGGGESFLKDWVQGGVSISDYIAPKAGELHFMANDGYYDDNDGGWKVTVTVTTTKTIEVPTDVKPITTKDPTTNNEVNIDIVPAIKDKLCSLKLLTHLNSNQGYYNRIVWMMMDGVERRLYLETALKDLPEILNVMDDMPLAVTGNYIAFPCNVPGFALAASSSSDVNKTKPDEYVEDIVCFPTRGLFAEAQLGHCNSCEERDITRMWDWNEMTTETPPDIAAITQGSKGVATTLTPTQLPGNVIQITTPQNAPDPTGLANALTLLGNGNAFRDMSGLNQVSSLLGQLSKESNESHIKAIAIMAKQKVDELKNNGGNGSGNGSGGGSGSGTQGGRPTATEKYDNLTVAKKEAAAMGLTPEEVAKYIADSQKKFNLIGSGAITSTDAGFVPNPFRQAKIIITAKEITDGVVRSCLKMKYSFTMLLLVRTPTSADRRGRCHHRPLFQS